MLLVAVLEATMPTQSPSNLEHSRRKLVEQGMIGSAEESLVLFAEDGFPKTCHTSTAAYDRPVKPDLTGVPPIGKFTYQGSA